MPSRLKLVKGATRKGALVYGMRFFPAQPELSAVEDVNVHFADGKSARITMHVIEGTREQVRNQLMRSIDAFFDLLEED